MANRTRRTKGVLRRALRAVGYDAVRAETPRFRTDRHPVPTPEPPDPRRLAELRSRYAAQSSPATSHTYWDAGRVATIDTGRFRAHGMFVWQYEERPSNTELRYFTFLRDVESKDTAGLLDRVEEDGAFGAPVFEFPARRPLGRDVIDSVNEILYLDRQLGLLQIPEARVVDIGAGYGRLAHRMAETVPGLVDYLCLDAVPESTHVCEHYLRYRGVSPPCRVGELPDAATLLTPGGFDLAINVHSFSEMPRVAVAHWLALLADAGVPTLFVIPNAATEVRSFEADGRRLDLLPILREAGFELDHREPVIADPAARALVGVEDHFHLFRRSGRGGDA